MTTSPMAPLLRSMQETGDIFTDNETDLSKKGRLENVHFINSNPVLALTRYVNDSYRNEVVHCAASI